MKHLLKLLWLIKRAKYHLTIIFFYGRKHKKHIYLLPVGIAEKRGRMDTFLYELFIFSFVPSLLNSLVENY